MDNCKALDLCYWIKCNPSPNVFYVQTLNISSWIITIYLNYNCGSKVTSSKEKKITKISTIVWQPFDAGYRYSIKNCLYEGALQKIIPECGCLPSFTENNYHNLEICTGEKLYCALEQLKFMGSYKDPDMTMVQTADNKTQKCLQRCDFQTETIMTTTSSFPNREMFVYRHEFCYVLQKIARVCVNPIQKQIFEQRIDFSDCCKQILELNNTLRVCDKDDLADLTITSSRPAVVDFLYDYSAKNLAVLNMFIRDPYYTKYLKSEEITPISFIGNAGGLLGLCMGMSFVSIFEVFYHLSNKIFKAIQKCCNFGSKKKIAKVTD